MIIYFSDQKERGFPSFVVPHLITIEILYTMHDEQEILLKENKDRFVILPINYPAIWEKYKKHEASFWTAEEIDLGDDMKDWNALMMANVILFLMCLLFLQPVMVL